MVGAAVCVVLGATTLGACRTNVGVAATVDGHRFSESDVGDYLTPQAKPVTEQNGTIQVPARSFVLETLIVDRLLIKIVDALPGNPPSQGTLAQVTQRGLNGSSMSKVAEAAGIKGYTAAFDKVWVRTKVYNTVLGQAQQANVDVRAAVAKLRFPVSVNPRYGTWDKSRFSLSSGRDAGLPDFLKLQPSSSASPTGTTPPR